MTLAEFLRREDGTDTRYELLAGFPVAMAPPAPAHGILTLRLGGRVDAALRFGPCFGQSEAGIVRPDRNDTCYIAGPCRDLHPARARTAAPSGSGIDRRNPVTGNDSASIFAEVLRREGDRWTTEIVRDPDATLSLASIGLTAAMSDLYEGIDLPDPSAAMP